MSSKLQHATTSSLIAYSVSNPVHVADFVEQPKALSKFFVTKSDHPCYHFFIIVSNHLQQNPKASAQQPAGCTLYAYVYGFET